MNPQITREDVIYFIVTDRFFGNRKKSVNPSDNKIHGGTLDGIIEKLDYLKELGVTAIGISPVYENIERYGSSEPYHYYWPQRFDRMDKRLLDETHLPWATDPSTFGAFVDTCHQKGFKVILEMVFTHVGYGAKRNFASGWFNDHSANGMNGTFMGLSSFNPEHTEVVDYFICNLKQWITSAKLSNLKIHAPEKLGNRFWYSFNHQILSRYPGIALIGVDGQSSGFSMDHALAHALQSTLIWDESLSRRLARPRLSLSEPPGALDDDFMRPERNHLASMLITLLDDQDMEGRIMSLARTRHPGEGKWLDMAIRVSKLCLGALFTMRGIPQIYYGTELGIEGWRENGKDHDLRRDFPWDVLNEQHQPQKQFHKEFEVYQWTRELIRLRMAHDSLKYGATITLWSDHLVYAFLRVSTEDVALVIINNGYAPMPYPVQLDLKRCRIPNRVITMVKQGLKHWITGEPLRAKNGKVWIRANGKTIDIYCR